MGGIASLFAKSSSSAADVFIDLETAQPSGQEKTIYDEASVVLADASDMLSKLTSYSGCDASIRLAISNPNPDSDKEVWAALVPNVQLLNEFFEYSRKLEKIFPVLLTALCSGKVDDNLSNQQALCKCLADIIDFALRWDDAKMVNPSFQNDFSYYRRSMNRMKLQKVEGADAGLSDEQCNRISLFLAFPTPMFKTLADTTAKFVGGGGGNGVTQASVVEGLALMANVCQDMVAKKKFTNGATNMLVLRAMTGCVVLADHVAPQGVFHKKSPVSLKAIVLTLKSYTDQNTDGLLNCLRFTSVHLNDPETPSSIKALLL